VLTFGPRHMAELTNLPRQDMFSEIAAGLPLILESAVELASAADALQADHARSKEILTLHAEEEAAKALMLLDLVRCPERLSIDRQRLGKQLTLHLSRLIYAETCKWHPATFGELRRGVDRERKAYYLDGPSGVDYIYRNNLIQHREELLYVDRMHWEHGYEWHKPKGPLYTEFKFLTTRCFALDVVRSLHDVGAFRREALDIIDTIWDPLDLIDSTHWHELKALNKATLERFDQLNWLENAEPSSIERAFEWPMPLYLLDCSLTKTTLGELQAERDRWTP
jgi:hypothetical protein